MSAPLAQAVGFAVSVIDPRESFATAARFPGSTLLTEWPDEGLRALSVDRHSAIVVLTHDRKLDDPALEVALRSPAFYVGALGSDRTQASRRTRLGQVGLGDGELDRLRGPRPVGEAGGDDERGRDGGQDQRRLRAQPVDERAGDGGGCRGIPAPLGSA